MINKFLPDIDYFDKLFPFSFLVDSKGRILRIGRSLRKLNPQLNNRDNIEKHYFFLKPQNSRFKDVVCNSIGEMIIMEDHLRQYQLMGQILNLNYKGRFVFAVNLFINDIKKINFLNLTFNDFAIQDQIFDFLMLLQTHERTIREADSINKKLAKAHEEAIKASSLKSQFLANMSHELRTPMNGVLGMASILQETSLDSEQKFYVENIVSSGENMLHLINDILDLSKIEAGFIQLDRSSFTLKQIIVDVLNTVNISANKKNLTLKTFVDEKLLNRNFIGDPDRLRQVLLNFVGNAIKFTLQGYVNIKIYQIDSDKIAELNSEKSTDVNLNSHHLRFEIEDSGVGMNDETLKSIFNPFVQGDSSTTKKFGGTGLGLSICKKIIQAMDGKCGVTSQLEVGSCFWFTIKLS